MLTDNQDFYPTPNNLIEKMWYKIKDKVNVKYILEPSAGKGDIVNFIKDSRKNYEISCIEKEPDLQALLVGKKYTVIDNNFLTYSGYDSFDAIIMNPPFSEGDKHLLKAIQILYSGQIVCLLNAETIKNPYTNTRKELVSILSSLNADIEYISSAFIDAERKTKIEVALIYIDKRKDISKEIMEGVKQADDIDETIDDSKDIVSAKPIEFMVADYNKTIDSGMKVLKEYFQNYERIGGYIALSSEDRGSGYLTKNNINSILNDKINTFIQTVRKAYWKRLLELKEVKSRMTEKKLNEFYHTIERQTSYDFTESNIRQFINNLMNSYQDILTDAVEDIFDKMTRKHHWNDESSDNVHYYNGWKTNKAYYVNKKVIMPMWGAFGSSFVDGYTKAWRIDYQVERQLNDIDIVMNYFDGLKEFTSIADAIKENLKYDKNRNFDSTYFTISVFKKGTIHLTFKNEDIRRRFNIEAGKRKNWLPPAYGVKSYGDMSFDEKAVVEEFEGIESYNKNLGLIGFVHKPDIKMLEAA